MAREVVAQPLEVELGHLGRVLDVRGGAAGLEPAAGNREAVDPLHLVPVDHVGEQLELHDHLPAAPVVAQPLLELLGTLDPLALLERANGGLRVGIDLRNGPHSHHFRHFASWHRLVPLCPRRALPARGRSIADSATLRGV